MEGTNVKEVDFIIELLSYVVERIKEEADAEVKRREKNGGAGGTKVMGDFIPLYCDHNAPFGREEKSVLRDVVEEWEGVEAMRASRVENDMV